MFKDCTSTLLLCTLVIVITTGTALEDEAMPNDYGSMDNGLVKGAVHDECLIRHCGRMVESTDFLECASFHCKPVKKWIDTTHYSEGRRSVLDSLERCIRLSCHGKGGRTLKQCAFSCSARKTKRNEAKRWVDPLNYGMGDEKRSIPMLVDEPVHSLSEEQTRWYTKTLCDRICSGVFLATGTDGQSRCRIQCQLKVEEAIRDY